MLVLLDTTNTVAANALTAATANTSANIAAKTTNTVATANTAANANTSTTANTVAANTAPNANTVATANTAANANTATTANTVANTAILLSIRIQLITLATYNLRLNLKHMNVYRQ